MQHYNSYHTIIKQLVKRNSLPGTYIQAINRATLWRWKQEPNNKYYGSELSNIEVFEQFISRKESQTVMRSYLKVAFMFSELLNKSGQLHNLIKQNLSQFVRTILQYRKVINIKIILRLCKVPISVFYYWRDIVIKKCKTSPIELCRKRYNNQLTSDEVAMMKKLLSDERFKFWPVCSIAYYALREMLLSVSLSTWYLYIRNLGIIRPVMPKKKKYRTGIRADKANQIWHADITIIKSKDNIRHCVYLLIDNFSRFILSWRIEEAVSARIRVDTIREAYNKYRKDPHHLTLITDGGPENNNNTLRQFVLNETENFSTAVALKDIPFSNSVIESQNRLFKYRYLFRQEYIDGDSLRDTFAEDVDDYNYSRPHISLEGYTPFEAFSGESGMEAAWKAQMRQTVKERISANKKGICELCQ
jgi:putative transposase